MTRVMSGIYTAIAAALMLAFLVGAAPKAEARSSGSRWRWRNARTPRCRTSPPPASLSRTRKGSKRSSWTTTLPRARSWRPISLVGGSAPNSAWMASRRCRS